MAEGRGVSVWRGMLMMLLSIGVTVVVLGIVRAVFALRFLDLGTLAENADRTGLLIVNALRFDLQVGCYIVLPLLLMWLVVCAVGSGLYQAYQGFARTYIPIVHTIVALVGAADIHYYSNFNKHFDIRVFDFFNEEPMTLIRGVYDEAPVLLFVVFTVAAYLVCWLLTKVGSRRIERTKATHLAVGVPLFLVLVAYGFRGSFSTFTLRAEDCYVSTSDKLNDCVPNAFFMLKKALSEKKESFVIRTDEEIVKSAGFESVEEAVAAALSIDVDSARKVRPEEALFGVTSEEPRCEGYNVVLIVVESWSGKLVSYEKKYGMDLLVSMRRHMESDIYFKHFVSAGMGTIEAVEHLTTYSPYERLFQSKYRNVEYPSASARVFRDAGYDTYFISGIKIAWQNCSEALPHQGFNHVVGKYEVLKEKPEAELNSTWGVYDHSMLEYLQDVLSDTARSGPKYIMALTSTSHTPFEFPEGYELPGLKLPTDAEAFAETDTVVTWQYLRGYQYESRAIGDFMTRLKESEAGRKTIVAITGDHWIRRILPYPETEDPIWNCAVPLYLYVPGGVEADTSRYGSHTDIMPTLANLTLKGARYYRYGADMLGEEAKEGTYGVNVQHTAVSPRGDREACLRKARAKAALNEIVFSRAITMRN